MEAVKSTVQKAVHGIAGTTGAGKTVLVTGGSGFVAAGVLEAFLSAGYHVRTTVRSHSSAEKVKKSHGHYGDKLSIVLVGDNIATGAFDEAVKGVDGVIHTASPFVLQVKDNVKDLLDPAIKGTNSILQSVHQHNPAVKRVVVTSSFASIIDVPQGNRPGHTYSEKDWNPVTYDQAADPKSDGTLVYCASKTFAEKAAFEYAEKNKTNFSIATICPPMVYGPPKQTLESLDKLNTSTADIYRLFNGSEKEVPPTAFWNWVDVRDVGQAHLKAYEVPEAAGQRYFCTAGRYSYQQICDIIRKDFPELREVTPKGNPGEPISGVFEVDNTKIREQLGIKFRTLEESIHDTVAELLAAQKKLGKPQ
ncbi:MAG: methylglyoxal reductase (NADPH-dependent) gre2 [Claussenomyces sp. TS43310]|nr:MAG: methylglyoxal reductase (NADPH-dependent) gre2 [Claussenomyces sp. TS43310]